MTVPEVCPIDGCTSRGWATMKQFRGHVNGKPDPAHNWDDVSEMIDADGAEDTSSETTDQDDADDTDDTDMASQTEYQNQHDGDDGADDTDTDTDDGDADGGGPTPSPSIPMDPKTLGMVLAVCIALWLTYRTLGGSDSTAAEPADSGGGDDVEPMTDPAGGLTE